MGGNPGGEGEWREGKWGKGVRRSIVRWWMETRLLMVDTLWCIQCQTAMLYTWNLFNIINQCDLNLKTYMCIYTYIYTYAYVYMEKKWTCRSFTWGMRISQWGLLLSSIHAFLGCNNSRCSENVLGVCTRAGEGSWGNGGGGGRGRTEAFSCSPLSSAAWAGRREWTRRDLRAGTTSGTANQLRQSPTAPPAG